MSYQIAWGKKIREGIVIFRTNVAERPESANVFDSLAAAYLVANDRARAIVNYERALALDPKMESALEALKKLRDQ